MLELEGFPLLNEQVRFFHQQYPGCQLLIQKGFELLSFLLKEPVKAVVTTQESGFLRSGIKRREVTEIFIPSLLMSNSFAPGQGGLP